ncbi:MAG: aminotransferase class V-fold PLP-dependent enzyme, partial [Ruminococcus sp.]|nr:aminotransferase class V-fold PLP-dependent enzyme [Ruminococcus sp.]
MYKMGAKGLEHYLDNSATTAVSRAAADKAYQVMTQLYGNPSSLHSKGMDAEHELTQARAAVAARLHASPAELTFTSGGTEANNLVLFGAAYANMRVRRKIVISAVEHSSVLEAARRLEDEGFAVGRIAPCADGRIHPDDVAAAVDKNTALVSV